MQQDQVGRSESETRLWAELEETFPANDPLAVTRRSGSDRPTQTNVEDARQGQIVLKTPLARISLEPGSSRASRSHYGCRSIGNDVSGTGFIQGGCKRRHPTGRRHKWLRVDASGGQAT